MSPHYPTTLHGLTDHQPLFTKDHPPTAKNWIAFLSTLPPETEVHISIDGTELALDGHPLRHVDATVEAVRFDLALTVDMTDFEQAPHVCLLLEANVSDITNHED